MTQADALTLMAEKATLATDLDNSKWAYRALLDRHTAALGELNIAVSELNRLKAQAFWVTLAVLMVGIVIGWLVVTL